ncbi:MAG: hypothetical protein IPJ13_04195 [Saprospiraceae bacterium]|nr:hypothetical protein [Saprospiraceae bacterium]
MKAFDIRNDWLTSDLRHAFNVKTKPNVTYFLKIASYENFPIYLNVSVICTPVSTNESCNTDLKVNCNDEWKGYFQSTTINATPNVCNENSSGHYYQVTGTGTHFLMTLDKYTGTKELKLSIIENDCINGRCLYQGSLSFQNSKTILFETKSNRKYIIKISSDQDDVVYRIKQNVNQNQTIYPVKVQSF